MDMEKKDLKKLTKGQLIKLLMNQRKNEEVESIKKPTPPPRTGKWESIKPKSVLQKSVNEDIILPPPEKFRNLLLKYRYPYCGEDMTSSNKAHDKGDPLSKLLE